MTNTNGEVVMIRYGRTANNQPKNTLYTIKVNNQVYFGISRCKIEQDQFSKVHGRYIASGRAELALEDGADSDDMLVHVSGLRGVVAAEKVGKLLQYFEQVDEYLAPEYTKRKR